MSDNPNTKLNSESATGEDLGSIHTRDSQHGHEESGPADGHDNKGFQFGEDHHDPNNDTNKRLHSNPHPDVSDRATDVYAPEQDSSTNHQDHRFQSTNGYEASHALKNNNISTISNSNGGTVTAPQTSNVNNTLYEDRDADPHRTTKPKKRSTCACLALICCIFFFLFLLIVVAVFAAVYFTVLFPSPSRDDVDVGTTKPSTIRPTFPSIVEISVGVTMTLNQTYQASYDNILSVEYQELVYNITSVMNSAFTNSELMEVYLRTDVKNISSGSIIVYSQVYLSDVPPNIVPDSSTEPIEQIQADVQTLVLDTIQSAADADGSALSSLDVQSNSITVETPEVILFFTTNPIAITRQTTTPFATTRPTTTLLTTSTTPLTTRSSSANPRTSQSVSSTTPTSTTQTVETPTTHQEDTQPPVLTCPDDQMVANDPGLNTAIVTWPDVRVTDNSGESLVAFSDLPSGSVFLIGATSVAYTVTDSSGNVGTCTFIVNVQDKEPPTLTCPSEITVPNDLGLGSAVVTWSEAIVSDNSQSAVGVVASATSGSTFAIGRTTVRYVATDESGNQGNCSFKVVVQDVEPPVVHCPGNQTLPAELGEVTTVVTWPEVTVTDNGPNRSPTPASTHVSGSRFPIGNTEVIFVDADDATNVGRCTFWITVQDVEPPTVACPADIIVYVVIGINNKSISWDQPTATDNAGIEGAVTCDAENGTLYSIGMHIVECSATDMFGNVGSCQFNIIVSEPIVQATGSLSLEGTFTPSLTDPNSEDYMVLEQKVIAAMDGVFSSGNESNAYGATSLCGFRQGSIVADVKVAFSRAVEQDDLETFMSDSINKAIGDGTIENAVEDSAQFNEVEVPEPNTDLRFNCNDRETLNPSQSIVSIQYRTGHGCAGVLITQRHILTAASCVQIGGTNTNILVGSPSLSGQEVTSQVSTIKRIYQHPGYNALTGENNIAVMELQMTLSETLMQPACLEYHALGTIQLSDYHDCFIAGWGTLINTIYSSMQSSPVNTLSNDVGSECDLYTYPFTMTRNKLCVSGATGTYGMCTADSGSPLMCKNQNNGWTLVGLSNYNLYNGCGIGVYTHVTQHWQFISSVVDNGVISAPCDTIEASTCAASLPYLSTFVTTQSSYEDVMQNLLLILSCHAHAELFFCSAFLQECRLSEGLVPCRGLCNEVDQSCRGQYELLFGESSWPIYCTDYPIADDPNELLCRKGTNPVCGTTNLRVTAEEPLILTSPSYPENYPDINDCTWLIEGPQDLNLVFKFKDLGIEECCDTLTVGSGSDSLDRSTIVKQYSGTYLASGFEVITHRKMWVRFQSDHSTSLQGFHLEVYAVESLAEFCEQPNAFSCENFEHCVPSSWRCDQVDDCSDKSDENLCPDMEQVRVYGLDSTTILSPGYPLGYASNTDMVWVITVDPQYQIHLLFVGFETEKQFDVVQIGHGDDPFASGSLFFEWSGARIPPPIRSTGDSLWIRLQSDDSVFRDGFELVVTAVIASEPIKCLADRHFDCGSNVCIPAGFQCDNVTDCIQGIDEIGCYGSSTCSLEEFQCSDGTCISLLSLCDGLTDCPDQSDEIGCPTRASTQQPDQSMASTQAPQPDCNSNPCFNGATCQDIGNTFLCLCVSGYQGMLCDQETNECQPNPCKNGGACTDGLNSYTCQCAEGFTGDHCDTNIDDCTSLPCQSGGVCVDGVNSFTCDCPLGFGGDLCEIAPCHPIESAICQGLLPYNTTVFPNDYANSHQDALDSLAGIASVLNCHPDMKLLHCSAVFPECPWPNYGMSTIPCRSVCDDVTAACADVFESTFNEPWPFECEAYMTGEGTFCAQAEGDIFGTGLCGTTPEVSVHRRILGGSNASPGHWPWIGSLRDSYLSHQCGATLLNERWAITAAHCFGNFHSVIFGDTQLNKPSPNRDPYRFLKIIPHPNYDMTMFDEENDIAMLYLNTRVNYTNFVRPSCLATMEDETLAYRECHIIGWGHTVEEGVVSDHLQEVMIPLLNPEQCRAKLGDSTISDNMICAGQPQGGIDTCQGDSGGPLVCQGFDDIWHLVGVTSFGFGCGRPNTPGVYARVSQYLDFIQSTIIETEESVENITLELNINYRIASPNFPLVYPNDAFKEWSITGPPGSQIVLTVISHSTEENYDYVNFGNSHDSGDLDSLIMTLGGDVDGQTLYSADGNTMWLYFVSDYSYEQAGFQYDLTAANPGDFVKCDDGPRVIPSTWVCDQYQDCPNASDEEGCPPQ